MREFCRFIFGRYWNDPDSRAVGYRSTLMFCWVMLTIAGFSTGAITLAIFNCATEITQEQAK